MDRSFTFISVKRHFCGQNINNAIIILAWTNDDLKKKSFLHNCKLTVTDLKICNKSSITITIKYLCKKQKQLKLKITPKKHTKKLTCKIKVNWVSEWFWVVATWTLLSSTSWSSPIGPSTNVDLYEIFMSFYKKQAVDTELKSEPSAAPWQNDR